MHTIRKGSSYQRWEPEEKVSDWDLMTREERFESLQKWYRWLGRKYGTYDTYDDLVQEAAIGAWTCLTTHDDPSRTFTMQKAKWAVVRVVGKKQAYTGSERGQGAQGHSIRSTIAIDTEVNEGALDELLTAQAFEQMEREQELAHIRDAVRVLIEEDRQLVFTIFWEGLTYPEAAKCLGSPVPTLRARWTNRIRPRLRCTLADMQPQSTLERRHMWQPEDEDRLVRLAAAGMTVPQIAEETGLPLVTLYKHVRRLGLDVAAAPRGRLSHRDYVA